MRGVWTISSIEFQRIPRRIKNRKYDDRRRDKGESFALQLISSQNNTDDSDHQTAH